MIEEEKAQLNIAIEREQLSYLSLFSEKNIQRFKDVTDVLVRNGVRESIHEEGPNDIPEVVVALGYDADIATLYQQYVEESGYIHDGETFFSVRPGPAQMNAIAESLKLEKERFSEPSFG